MDTKVTIRNISMIISVACVAFSGLFFILFADLYLRADSVELFLGIFFPLASVVFIILAESFKHKPVVFYIFKALAVILAVAFIYYVFYFETLPRFTDTRTFLKLIKDTEDGGKVFFLDSAKFNDGISIAFNKMPPYIFMIVVAFIGAVAEAVNFVFNVLVGLD